MDRAADPLLSARALVLAPSKTIAFVVMVVALVVAPFFTYPLFLMQAMCFALFACAFNLLIVDMDRQYKATEIDHTDLLSAAQRGASVAMTRRRAGRVRSR